MDKCKECGGSRQTIVEDFEFGNHPVTCSHCQGTGIEPEVIGIEGIPEGYEFDHISNWVNPPHATFYKGAYRRYIQLPYTIGKTYDEVCEVCYQGIVKCENCERKVTCPILEKHPKCPRCKCKGKPTKYKIKDIQVKDNNFIIYKGALTNKRDLRTGWKYK